MTHEQMKASARQMLEDDILKFWQTRMVDTKRGGFYGRIDGCNLLHPDAPKGAVLNARILWSFASASRVLHRMPYRIMAARAKDYILQRFIDPQYGGVYWSLNADGTPLDTKKQTYAIAFTIYALAEDVRVTKDQEALHAAIRLFEDMEEHAFDAEHVGYIEALTRDWKPIDDMRLSEHDENGAFTMNTHLHVLEAYTNLYRVWPDERVAQKLRTLVSIFTDRLYNPDNHHVDSFFDTGWNGRRDIASYGHDIETAWLLNEALSVLNQRDIPHTARIALASLEGLQPDGSLVHEDKDASRQWWVECEAVVGFLDQWAMTCDETWYLRAEQAFRYITTRLVDRENGEFYWAVLPDGSIDTENDKAGFWKCPYHNSRMCLEILQRL